MKTDKITRLSCEFKKCQKLVYALVCLPAMFTGMQTFSTVFTLFIPRHRCSIPEIDNDTYKVQGHWHEIITNRSIPLVKGDDDMFEYADCEIFETNQNTTYNFLNSPINTSTIKCNKWVYDNFIFEETFITKENLVCEREIARANANMIYMSGVLTGSIATGIFSDIFGRKKILMVCVFLHIGSAFGSAFVSGYILFVSIRFVVGFSNIGMYVTTFVIVMELVDQAHRAAAGFAIEVLWCIGLYLLCFLAFYVRLWNMLLLAMASPTVLLFACLCVIPESPLWLKSKGRHNDANKIIQKWTTSNENLPENNLRKDAQDTMGTESVLKMLTIPTLLIRTLIIYLNWCVVNMVNYGLTFNIGNLKGDVYVNFAITSSMELIAYTVCFFTLNKLGRKVLHASTMILCGVACLSTIFTMLYADKSLYWITVVLTNIGKLGVTAAHAIIYLWSAELFPTKVRNSGMGSSTMIAFVGSMVCPYIADLEKYIHGRFGKVLPPIVLGSLSVLAGLLSLVLPETNGRILPETVLDAVKFGKDDLGSKDTPSTVYYINDAFNKDKDTSEENKTGQ